MCFCFVSMCMNAHSCLTLCNPMDCRPPGSSVHGFFQARILDRVAISFSREYSWSRDWTHLSWTSWTGRWVLYHWCHSGSLPHYFSGFTYLLDVLFLFLCRIFFIRVKRLCYTTDNWQWGSKNIKIVSFCFGIIYKTWSSLLWYG